MPVYTIRDRQTGQTLDIRGTRPPTEEEAAQLFGQHAADVDQAGNEIERSIAKYKALGVPTDELGQPTRPLTRMEQFNDAILHPSPGAQLGGDLAAMAAGLFGGKGSFPKQTAAAPAAVDTPSVPSMIAKGVIKKVTGLDADEMGMKKTRLDLQTARLELQRARAQSRIAAMKAEAETPPAPARAAAKTAKGPQPLILTPEQIQLHRQQMANAELLAREQGMKSAAYGSAAWDQPQAAPTPASVAPSARAAIKAPKSDKLADTPITPDMEAMADRMSGGADQPTKGNGTFTSPGETSSVSPPRGRGAAPAQESPAPPPNSSRVTIAKLKSAGLTEAEAPEAEKWLRQGVEVDQIVKRIHAMRALKEGMPSLEHLPTTLEALREVRNR